MKKKRTILYYKKGATIYKMKESDHKYVLSFLSTYWEQIWDDYKEKNKDQKYFAVGISQLPSYMLEKDIWEKFIKELGSGACRHVNGLGLEKAITIYVESSNAAFCNFQLKKQSKTQQNESTNTASNRRE